MRYIHQILASEGGIVLTKEIAHRLLTNLKGNYSVESSLRILSVGLDFPAWSQCILMGILVRYVPSNEDEIYDILVLYL